tara:strand:- start:7966 stop:8112 length:147 start_codon:yes stop_codon:yes gene_type:complete
MNLDNAKIIGGIMPNLIVFGLLCIAITYFALTGEMVEMLGIKNSRVKK